MAKKPLYTTEDQAEMIRGTTWNAGPHLTPDPLLTCDICGKRSRQDVIECADHLMRCGKCRSRAFSSSHFGRDRLVEIV